MFMQLAQAWLDDLLVHDVDAPLNPYMLASCQRNVARRAVTRDHPRGDGAADYTKYTGAQVFDLDGYVDADADGATQDAYDALEAVCEPGRDIVFRFRRLGRAELERARVRCHAIDAPAAGFTAQIRYAATLLGGDPLVYSDTLRVSRYDPTEAGSGFGLTFPLEFPLDFGTPPNATLELFNAGNTRAPALWRIHGPATNPAVVNDSTGETIAATTATLDADDVLELDTGLTTRRTIRLNGNDRRDLLDGATTWAGLPPGPSDVRLTGSAMVADQTELEASWRDARR